MNASRAAPVRCAAHRWTLDAGADAAGYRPHNRGLHLEAVAAAACRDVLQGLRQGQPAGTACSCCVVFVELEARSPPAVVGCLFSWAAMLLHVLVQISHKRNHWRNNDKHYAPSGGVALGPHEAPGFKVATQLDGQRERSPGAAAHLQPRCELHRKMPMHYVQYVSINRIRPGPPCISTALAYKSTMVVVHCSEALNNA